MTTEKSTQIAVNLHDADGDIRKRKFIFFYLVNPKTGLNQRVKINRGLNKWDTISDREKAAKKFIAKIKRDLKRVGPHFWLQKSNILFLKAIGKPYNSGLIKYWRKIFILSLIRF